MPLPCLTPCERLPDSSPLTTWRPSGSSQAVWRGHLTRRFPFTEAATGSLGQGLSKSNFLSHFPDFSVYQYLPQSHLGRRRCVPLAVDQVGRRIGIGLRGFEERSGVARGFAPRVCNACAMDFGSIWYTGNSPPGSWSCSCPHSRRRSARPGEEPCLDIGLKPHKTRVCRRSDTHARPHLFHGTKTFLIIYNFGSIQCHIDRAFSLFGSLLGVYRGQTSAQGDPSRRHSREFHKIPSIK